MLDLVTAPSSRTRWPRTTLLLSAVIPANLIQSGESAPLHPQNEVDLRSRIPLGDLLHRAAEDADQRPEDGELGRERAERGDQAITRDPASAVPRKRNESRTTGRDERGRMDRRRWYDSRREDASRGAGAEAIRLSGSAAWLGRAEKSLKHRAARASGLKPGRPRPARPNEVGEIGPQPPDGVFAPALRVEELPPHESMAPIRWGAGFERQKEPEEASDALLRRLDVGQLPPNGGNKPLGREFERLAVRRLLSAEVVADRRHVRLGPLRDPPDTCSVEPLFRKLLAGGFE